MFRRTRLSLIAVMAALAAVTATGCGNKDPNSDPSAPVVLQKPAGPSAVKTTIAPPSQQTVNTAGQVDPDQQKALEMEAASASDQRQTGLRN